MSSEKNVSFFNTLKVPKISRQSDRINREITYPKHIYVNRDREPLSCLRLLELLDHDRGCLSWLIVCHNTRKKLTDHLGRACG